MKKTLLAFLIIVLFSGTFSCQEKSKIELIRAGNNNEYSFIKKQINRKGINQLGVLNFDEEQIKNINKTIEGIKKKLKENNYKNDKLFNHIKFVYALYINEKGSINKIVSLASISKEIDAYVVSELQNWEMNKYSLDYPKKYAINWEFSFFKPKDKENYSFLKSNLLPANKTSFIQVEKMPSPIGGIKGIQERIKYPELAKRSGIEGRVFVKAFIDENGNVTKAEIIKGLDGGCDEEAIKAVMKTKFEPGRQRGKAVKVQVTVPILFKLDSKKRTEIEKNRETIAKEEIQRVKSLNNKSKVGFILLGFNKTTNDKAIVTGKIYTEKSKEPIVAANISVVGTKIGAASDELGNYTISNIPTGKNQLTFSHAGFSKLISREYNIEGGKSYAIDIIVKK